MKLAPSASSACPATPDDFVRHAVDFANDTLPGTLGATLLVHPRTERDSPCTLPAAVDRLRYGTIGVNTWSGVGFLLGHTPWGARPGHTRQDIGSGTGFVDNARMLADVEKTVLRAPFAPAHPRSPRARPTWSPTGRPHHPRTPRPPHHRAHRRPSGPRPALVPARPTRAAGSARGPCPLSRESPRGRGGRR
ncbi:hypothetical protein [Kitasatospora sp. NPDC059571]|uniref:hypothetical protein n=1 Tax=Kitasatospora sp. NPDC059571 TaxID=3346871 RepID=UPI0036A729A8